MDAANQKLFEERLIQRCLEGDDRAWETIIREYSRRVYNLAYQYTRNTGQAEDLTQEIFLRVYQSLASFRPASGSLLNWLMRVSRNLIIDHYRQNRRLQTTAGSDLLEKLDFGDSRQRDALDGLQKKQEHALLWNCLATLSPELREAVILRDLQELTYEEIGNILRVPEGTVKSRINRGRIELAKVLRKRKARLEG